MYINETDGESAFQVINKKKNMKLKTLLPPIEI